MLGATGALEAYTLVAQVVLTLPLTQVALESYHGISLYGGRGERSYPTWPGCRAWGSQRRDCGTHLPSSLSLSLSL